MENRNQRRVEVVIHCDRRVVISHPTKGLPIEMTWEEAEELRDKLICILRKPRKSRRKK